MSDKEIHLHFHMCARPFSGMTRPIKKTMEDTIPEMFRKNTQERVAVRVVYGNTLIGVGNMDDVGNIKLPAKSTEPSPYSECL